MSDISIVPSSDKIPNSLMASEPSAPGSCRSGEDATSSSADVCRSAIDREGRVRGLGEQSCASVCAQHPNVSELRVLLGMALCVNLDAQAAMEELAEAVALAPDSFIAHLKAGELWMRLRVMNKAEDHTRQASMLAQNLAQSELARRQATTIRTMRREGIERDGYRTPWLSFGRLRRLWTRKRSSEELATADAQ